MRPHSFTRELGLSHAEFFESLPGAINHRPYRRDGSRLELELEGGRRVRIDLGPEQYREIALLRLPYCEVRFDFHGFDDESLDAFMHRFELYFRRGGG